MHALTQVPVWVHPEQHQWKRMCPETYTSTNVPSSRSSGRCTDHCRNTCRPNYTGSACLHCLRARSSFEALPAHALHCQEALPSTHGQSGHSKSQKWGHINTPSDAECVVSMKTTALRSPGPSSNGLHLADSNSCALPPLLNPEFSLILPTFPLLFLTFSLPIAWSQNSCVCAYFTRVMPWRICLAVSLRADYTNVPSTAAVQVTSHPQTKQISKKNPKSLFGHMVL